MKNTLLSILLATIASLLVLSPTPLLAQVVTVTTVSPIEAKLAALDSGRMDVKQSTINNYTRLLNELGKKCKEERRLIGDYASKGVELLKEKNVSMNRLEFLEAMNQSIPENAKAKLNVRCAEISALLVTITNRR